MTPLILGLGITVATAAIGIVIVLGHYHPELTGDEGRQPLVLKAVAAGSLAVLPAAVLETLIGPPLRSWVTGRLGILAIAFGQVALVEEGCKFLAIHVLVTRDGNMKSVRSAWLAAVIAGLSFASFESVAYLTVGTSVPLLRAATAAPVHACAAGMIGYAAGRARFDPPGARGRALASAVILHGTYDLTLVAGPPLSWSALAIVAIALVSLSALAKKIE